MAEADLGRYAVGGNPPVRKGKDTQPDVMPRAATAWNPPAGHPDASIADLGTYAVRGNPKLPRQKVDGHTIKD